MKLLVLSIITQLLFTVSKGANANCANLISTITQKKDILNSHNWLEAESQIALKNIFLNVSPKDARAGAIIAAQTRVAPNYYYHWVRDAALVVEAMIAEYLSTQNSQHKKTLYKKIMEYVDYTDYIQNKKPIAGLGEPKFHVDGKPYMGLWGRPQNDGPALRAVSLMQWYQTLQKEGLLSHSWSKRLYTADLPAESIIKKDLEYVSHHWNEPSYDLWEEVNGTHFYTLMVQRRAMVEGADFAFNLGDEMASKWYRQQAKAIDSRLHKFWDEGKGHIIATRNYKGGFDYKHSNLDIAVILALNHASLNDDLFRFNNPKVIKTLEALEKAFSEIYPINKREQIPGVAIGRYPEDMYGGDHTHHGNPWPMTTLAMAEAYYRAGIDEMLTTANRKLALQYAKKADEFVSRVAYHQYPDGSLSEQIDRYTGFMTSVEDLTWNYAAVLTALAARRELFELL